LKTFLDNKFKIKDLIELNYFLGMEVTKFPTCMALIQKKFPLDLLKEFQCDNLSPTSYPCGPLSKSDAAEEHFVDVTSYRKLVRKFNHLTNT